MNIPNVTDISLRPADPQNDYAAVADIINTFESQPIRADTLREWDQITRQGALRRRMVAVEDNQIVGYSVVSHNVWDKAGDYITWLVVDPRRRGHGVGARLLEDATAFAGGCGATSFSGVVRDNDADSLRFAEKRGFAQH